MNNFTVSSPGTPVFFDSSTHAEAGGMEAKNTCSLGSNAKSSSLQDLRGLQPVENIDKATGEIIQEKNFYCPSSVRLERFALQSSVRYLIPDSRTAKCLRLLQCKGSEEGSKFGLESQHVKVFRSNDHQTAHYSGLQTCSSVWACPVCAAKISERRRSELLHAMDKHQSAGGYVYLLTLTNPHDRTDSLGLMLKAQACAMSRLNGTKAAQKLWADIGCIGTVRAWEVTHGQNGWHPHFHILLFVQSSLDLDYYKARFFAVWFNCCRLAGLPEPSFSHGVRLDDGSKASNYVAKGMWGLDREMTKGHMKKAKNGGFSPFDLLRNYLYDRDKQSAALFIEYFKAFKGKRQLVWSKGLKSQFLVQELNDSEVAARVDDDAFLLGRINIDEWRLIRRFNLRGELLELARHGWEPVQRLLSDLTKKTNEVKK